MDVYCTTCGEPWDHNHLWQDAVHETNLDEQEIKVWSRLPLKERLTPHYRSAFQGAGYEFGRTLAHVVRCPGCLPGAKPEPGKLSAKLDLEDLLGDDIDGIVSTFNDHRL